MIQMTVTLKTQGKRLIHIFSTSEILYISLLSSGLMEEVVETLEEVSLFTAEVHQLCVNCHL